MTDKMKLFLTRASGKLGVTGTDYESFTTAQNNGWLTSGRLPQNSTSMRYHLTEAGRAALSAAG